MAFNEFYKEIDSISADEAHAYIEQRDSSSYSLLDVRQPGEYEGGHLPGAMLIPLGELAARTGELDTEKPVVVYCRSGSRSLSAASLLLGAGIKSVMNMEGGIMAYNGATARGAPEAGMFCFPPTLNPGQLAAMAWFLENGTLAFFTGVRDKCNACEEPGLFDELTGAKEAHKKTLAALYQRLTGDEPTSNFPHNVMELPPEDIMAGCVKAAAALEWAEGKTPVDVLELVVSLEANALDLYLKLARSASSKEAQKVFSTLSDEQVRTLKRTAAAFEHQAV